MQSYSPPVRSETAEAEYRSRTVSGSTSVSAPPAALIRAISLSGTVTDRSFSSLSISVRQSAAAFSAQKDGFSENAHAVSSTVHCIVMAVEGAAPRA